MAFRVLSVDRISESDDMRQTVTIGLAFVIAIASAPALAMDIHAELNACRMLQSDAERLTCYDAIGAGTIEPVAGSTPEAAPDPSAAPAPEPTLPAESSVAAPTPAPPVEAPVAEPVPVARDLPTPEETFGKSASETYREQKEAFGKEEIRELAATVAELRRMGNYKMEITLDNGQKWHQITSSYLTLKVGDDIVIKRAALDSYKLLKVGNNRAMKVRRVK
jgi:hypothetical protein